MSYLDISRQSIGTSDADDLGSVNSNYRLYDNDFQPEYDCSQPNDHIFWPISLDQSVCQSLPVVHNVDNESLASRNEAACNSTGSFAVNNASLSPISDFPGITTDYSLSGVNTADPTLGCGDMTPGDWNSIALQYTAALDFDSSFSARDIGHLQAPYFASDSNTFTGIKGDHQSAASPEAAFSSNQLLYPKTPTTLPRQFQCNRPSTKSQSAGEICRASFRQQRDYDRHLKTVHSEKNDPKYGCRCTASTVRKDNYVRHVQKCAKELRKPFYHCKCGDECRDKSAHLRHVKDCAKCNGKRGRPCGTKGTA